MVDQEVDDSILSTLMEIDIVMLVVWVSIKMILRYEMMASHVFRCDVKSLCRENGSLVTACRQPIFKFAQCRRKQGQACRCWVFDLGARFESE